MDKKQVRKNLDELRNRAQKRTLSLSTNPKDAKVENDFFDVMSKQIYTQIARN